MSGSEGTVTSRHQNDQGINKQPHVPADLRTVPSATCLPLILEASTVQSEITVVS